MPKTQVSVTSTAADQPTDRESDSRCLSPLRRKTSELEGEPTKGSKKSQGLSRFNDVRRRLHCHKHIYALKNRFVTLFYTIYLLLNTQLP
jgi:hypothetical protein